MVESQDSYNPVFQEFYQWARDAHSMGSGDAGIDCTRPFIPYPKLQAYFQDVRGVRKLLAALFPDDEPPRPEHILKHYSKVFFILLLIEKGQYIGYFVQHGTLADQHLPFESQPASFPIIPSSPDFFDSFYNKQWEFCAPMFEDNMDKRFEAKEILPIISKERLAGGGSATTYKITLHPAYNLLNSERGTGLDMTDQHAHTYVMKTYETRDAEKYFSNEVSAFQKLQREGKDPNIIGFHGSFTQNGTYNVLLEFADKGTLEEYFEKTSPPSSGEDVIKFWRGLFKILSALNMIHNVPHGESDGPQFFQGCHQDVKPANILIKSSKGGSAFDCLFKLGDLGLSHFTRTVSPQANARGRDSYGTRAYGAPECYRVKTIERHPIHVGPNVDIWSLGCVFSEAAIWVVRGWDGLQEYRRRRRIETSQIHDFGDADCFHDGEKTLAVVHEMHENLARDRRPSDHVTEATLNRLIKDMVEEEAGRPNARMLYFRSEKILIEAEKRLGTSAGKRSFFGGMHNRGGSGSTSHDRPQTPPQLPDGYPQSQPKSPQRYNTAPYERQSSPESMAHAPPENRHSTYNSKFPARNISKPSLQFSGNGHSILMEPESYNSPESEDEDQFPDSPSGPISNVRDHSRPTSSKHQQGFVGSKHGRNNVRDGAFPASSYENDLGFRDLHLSQRASGQDQFPGPSTAASVNDTGARHRDSRAHRRTNQHSPPNVTRPPFEQPPLMESLQEPRETPPPPIPATQKKTPPRLSLAAAHKWKSDKKMGIKSSLPHGHLIETLNKRDHVFLIDDSLSMRSHWREVQHLFGLLAYMVKDSDPDGIELHFTISSDKYRSKHTKQLVKALGNKIYDGHSNIRLSLKTIVQKYKDGLKEPVTPAPSRWNFVGRSTAMTGPVRDQNVYVFTDGVWQPDCDPTEIIESLVASLKEHKVLKEQFGIQFVSFGTDPEGLAMLKCLDSELNLPMDIIDTTPSTGNVWKMLLGAVNKWFDDDPIILKTSTGSPPPSAPTNGANAFEQRAHS